MITPFKTLSSACGVSVPTKRPISVRAKVASSTVLDFRLGVVTSSWVGPKSWLPTNSRTSADTIVAIVTTTHFLLLPCLASGTAGDVRAGFVIGITVVVPRSVATGALFGRLEIGIPAIARSISNRISAAVWYLSAGDFVSAVSVIASNVVGIAGSIEDGSFGASFTC